MDATTRKKLLTEITDLLVKGHAHVTLEVACADVPPALLNQPAASLPYTLWQLLEHIRIAQLDILEFSLGTNYRELNWPADYWPAPDDHADEARWRSTLAQIQHDRARFLDLLRDPTHDLLAPLPHGSGQTLLREAFLLADHAAYHTGQLILVRRLLGNWE